MLPVPSPPHPAPPHSAPLSVPNFSSSNNGSRFSFQLNSNTDNSPSAEHQTETQENQHEYQHSQFQQQLGHRHQQQQPGLRSGLQQHASSYSHPLTSIPFNRTNSTHSSIGSLGSNVTTDSSTQQEAARRSNHNAIERARREILNSKFQELASLIPSLSHIRKPSKSAIVNKSLELFHDLKQKLAHSEHVVGMIKQRNFYLASEVARLRAMLGLLPMEDNGDDVYSADVYQTPGLYPIPLENLELMASPLQSGPDCDQNFSQSSTLVNNESFKNNMRSSLNISFPNSSSASSDEKTQQDILDSIMEEAHQSLGFTQDDILNSILMRRNDENQINQENYDNHNGDAPKGYSGSIESGYRCNINELNAYSSSLHSLANPLLEMHLQHPSPIMTSLEDLSRAIQADPDTPSPQFHHL